MFFLFFILSMSFLSISSVGKLVNKGHRIRIVKQFSSWQFVFAFRIRRESAREHAVHLHRTAFLKPVIIYCQNQHLVMSCLAKDSFLLWKKSVCDGQVFCTFVLNLFTGERYFLSIDIEQQRSCYV